MRSVADGVEADARAVAGELPGHELAGERRCARAALLAWLSQAEPDGER